MLSLALVLACATPPDPMLGRWVVAFYATVTEQPGTAGTSSDPVPEETARAPAQDTAEETAQDTAGPCEDDPGGETFRGWLEILTADPVSGSHVVLHAGSDRPAASQGVVPSGGMTGPLRGGFLDGELQVHLLADPGSPLAGPSDAAAWSEGHIVLKSAGWSRECHEARWDWVDLEGVVDPAQGGRAFLRRG